MAIDYAALKAECQTNPNGYSYTDVPSNTTLTLAQWFAADAAQVCADVLNAVRGSIAIARSNVTPQEIIEAIDVRDLSASATTLQASWFESFTQTAAGVSLLKPNGSDARILTNLLRIMANTNNSETRLRNLATRAGSRAEQLFGENTVLTAQDITKARNA